MILKILCLFLILVQSSALIEFQNASSVGLDFVSSNALFRATATSSALGSAGQNMHLLG